MSNGKYLGIHSTILSDATITIQRRICVPRSSTLPCLRPVVVVRAMRISPTAHRAANALKKNSRFMIAPDWPPEADRHGFRSLPLALPRCRKRRMRRTAEEKQEQLSTRRDD